MEDKLEKLIKLVYKKWKKDEPGEIGPHPSEEDFACFFEGKLAQKESEGLKAHLLKCAACAEIISANLNLMVSQNKEVPAELIRRVKGLAAEGDKANLLEIILRFKEKAIEIFNVTGDILLGQELVPAPVLRSRQIKDFKDEITIYKDFKDFRVKMKIENKGGGIFNLEVVVTQTSSQEVIKDLRVTLLKDETELESYLNDSGKVIFEHVLLGKYTVEIASPSSKLASVLLDIRT